MNLPDVPLLSLLRERMSWLNSRQGLLSQNVANADTPGYAARDLKPIDFESELKQGTARKFPGLITTNPKHLVSATSGPTHVSDADITQTPAAPGENSVSIEEEMIKVADTQAQYQAASNLYAKAINMMRTAIGQP